MSAAPVSIAIFEFLDSTHQDIQDHVRQLHGLVDAIESDGLNAATRALGGKMVTPRGYRGV